MVTLCVSVLFSPYPYITLRKSSSKCLFFESEVSDIITPGVTANKMGNGDYMGMAGSELFEPMSYDHRFATSTLT